MRLVHVGVHDADRESDATRVAACGERKIHAINGDFGSLNRKNFAPAARVQPAARDAPLQQWRCPGQKEPPPPIKMMTMSFRAANPSEASTPRTSRLARHTYTVHLHE